MSCTLIRLARDDSGVGMAETKSPLLAQRAFLRRMVQINVRANWAARRFALA
ncbi:MAG: hypothetical protein JWN74_2455 [Acidobacteriaceae bacterium]|nr:hypothetical protein [Acidobacteriaceae bacterium]